MKMNLLNFYTILAFIGLILNIAAIVLYNNQGTVEVIAFCVLTGYALLFIGIRGIVNKFKSYM
jgi:hypothetical protein